MEDMWRAHTTNTTGHRKTHASGTRCTADQPWRRCAQGKKLDIKGGILADSSPSEFSEKANLYQQ